MPAAEATVFGGRGSGRLWKKDGMEYDDGGVTTFCLSFFTMLNGRLESMTMLVADAEVKNRGEKSASALG